VAFSPCVIFPDPFLPVHFCTCNLVAHVQDEWSLDESIQWLFEHEEAWLRHDSMAEVSSTVRPRFLTQR
jgi:hypothetical protein